MSRQTEDRKVISFFLASLVFLVVICLAALSGTIGFHSLTDMPAVGVTSQSTKPTQQLLVNINQATEEELMQLEGIGEVLAGRIVAYRQTNGAFRTKEELLNVKGIGEKVLEEIRPYITV